MNCWKCGKEVLPGAKFCGFCGASLASSAAPGAGAPPAPSPEPVLTLEGLDDVGLGQPPAAPSAPNPFAGGQVTNPPPVEPSAPPQSPAAPRVTLHKSEAASEPPAAGPAQADSGSHKVHLGKPESQTAPGAGTMGQTTSATPPVGSGTGSPAPGHVTLNRSHQEPGPGASAGAPQRETAAPTPSGPTGWSAPNPPPQTGSGSYAGTPTWNRVPGPGAPGGGGPSAPPPPGPGGPAGPGYPPGPSMPPRGTDLTILIKAFAILYLVAFTYSAISSVGNIIYCIVGFIFNFDTWRLSYQIYTLVSNILQVVPDGILSAAIAFTSFLIFRKWDRERADGALLCFGIPLLLRPVLFHIVFGLSLAVFGVTTYSNVPDFLWTEFKAALGVVIFYVLCWANGVKPLIGKSQEEIMYSVRLFLGSLQEIQADAAARRAAQAASAAGSRPMSPVPEGTPRSSYAGSPYRMKENRSIILFFILNVITCGIYGLYNFYCVARDTNILCDGDNRRTEGLLMYLVLGVCTCNAYTYIWYYAHMERLRETGRRYGVQINTTGLDIVLWFTAGTLLCGLGPLIAWYFILKSLNELSRAYNAYYGL